MRVAEGYDRACAVATKHLEEIADVFEYSLENKEKLIEVAITTPSSNPNPNPSPSPALALSLTRTLTLARTLSRWR